MFARKRVFLLGLVVLLIAALFTAINIGSGDLEAAVAKGDHKSAHRILFVNPGAARNKGYHDYTPLHWAAMTGDREMVEFLLSKGADVNAQSKENVSPLYLASLRGHTDIVKLLIQRGAKVNVSCTYTGERCGNHYTIYGNYNAITPLHIAATKGYSEVVNVLIKNGAYINAVADDKTPLQLAAKEGRRKAVALLLNAGANPNKRSKDQNTAFSGTEDPVIAEMFIKHGVSIDTKDSSGCTPLLNAAWAGYAGVTEVLLKHGANPNARDPKGYTPLLMIVGCPSCLGNNARKPLPMVESLLNHGANADLKSKDGLSPTELAAVCGNKEVVKLLRQHGGKTNSIFAAIGEGDTAKVKSMIAADPTIISKARFKGNSPFHLAILRKNCELAEFMLENGADIYQSTDEQKDDSSSTPLQLAVWSDHVPMIKLLMNRLPSPNLQELLMQAVDNDSVEAVKYLLKRGANPNRLNKTQYDSELKTPLELAAMNGYTDVMEALLKSGAQVNMGNKSGYTPLIHAAGSMENGKKSMELLLKHGADINAQTKSKQTILAQQLGGYGFSGGVEFLLSHGADPDRVVTEASITDPSAMLALMRHDGTQLLKDGPVDQKPTLAKLVDIFTLRFLKH